MYMYVCVSLRKEALIFTSYIFLEYLNVSSLKNAIALLCVFNLNSYMQLILSYIYKKCSVCSVRYSSMYALS